MLLFVFCILSCEDNKKEGDITTESATETEKEAASKKASEEKKKTNKKHPVITNENVVDFLTTYGEENPETLVRITSRYGNIDIQLYEDTPLHRANFIYLVKNNYFNDTYFHRIVPNFIIQGGNSDNSSTNKKRARLGKDYLIPAEIIPGRGHTYGSVSGAKEYRENPDKKSAPYEFFIFLGPPTSTSHLDGNYTVYGKVVKGMDVVEKIAQLPRDEGDWPLQNITITATVLE